MRLKCLECNNTNKEKFTSTPNGIICLCCYEKNVEMIAENQSDEAQIAIANHVKFNRQNGRVRRFAQGYRAMAKQLSTLNSIPNMSDMQKCFLDGYMEAVKVFHENS